MDGDTRVQTLILGEDIGVVGSPLHTRAAQGVSPLKQVVCMFHNQ